VPRVEDAIGQYVQLNFEEFIERWALFFAIPLMLADDSTASQRSHLLLAHCQHLALSRLTNIILRKSTD
jgi:hypothetical protein